MVTPTPGAKNDVGVTGMVGDTTFSVDRGFYDAPFQLIISTNTPGAQIRYTTNGSPPTATTGTVYTGPITIDRTTTIRAAAFKTGLVPSNVDTQTYIFLNDVVRRRFKSTISCRLSRHLGHDRPGLWDGSRGDRPDRAGFVRRHLCGLDSRTI